jgi:hypothetical protein
MSIWDKLLKVVKGSNPLINSSQSFTEQVRESWVAAIDPSSWGDSVSLILDLTWIELIELTEKSCLQQVRMESSHTINSMGANDREICHSNLLWPSFLNKTHPSNFGWISWIFLLKLGDIDMVDQIDEIHVSWQQVLNQIATPLLKCFWKYCMVGITESVVHNIPSLLE